MTARFLFLACSVRYTEIFRLRWRRESTVTVHMNGDTKSDEINNSTHINVSNNLSNGTF